MVCIDFVAMRLRSSQAAPREIDYGMDEHLMQAKIYRSLSALTNSFGLAVNNCFNCYTGRAAKRDFLAIAVFIGYPIYNLLRFILRAIHSIFFTFPYALDNTYPK